MIVLAMFQESIFSYLSIDYTLVAAYNKSKEYTHDHLSRPRASIR